jgi:hypothetical protein
MLQKNNNTVLKTHPSAAGIFSHKIRKKNMLWLFARI